MGGVNASPRYVQAVDIGLPNGTVTDQVHQGGIVSVYYLGCIVGCFAGGWAADRVGRINGHVLLIPGIVLSADLTLGSSSDPSLLSSEVPCRLPVNRAISSSWLVL